MAATRSRGTRRLAIVVLAVVAVIGAIAVAVPFLISSEAVKKRISDQVTHWTGRTFTFGGDAKLRLFPYLTVRLQNVRLANPAGMEGQPFISAGVMTGKLEILPLLLGRLEFAEFRLVNPRINLMVDAAGQPNWILDQGVIGTLASKGDSELSGDDPAPPSPRAEISLGRFLIRDGTVSYADARNGMREVMSRVNVNVAWRTTEEAAAASGTFVWRDEPVSLTGEINTPLTLLAGGDSPLKVSVETAPAALSFEGVARQFDGMQIEGAVSLVVPSLARFAAWTGAPLGDEPMIGAASVAGLMSWTAGVLSLGGATVDLDGNAGEGALTATVVDGRPGLQGTLDFARFDFTPYLAYLSGAIDSGGAWLDDPIRLSLLDAAHIDLRLSAGQAVAAANEIGPVAASLMVKQGKLLVDIGEAHLGGGLVEASVGAEMNAGGLSAKASIKVENLPAQAAAAMLGTSGVTGIASATIDLAGMGRTWRGLIGDLAGAASVNLVEGTVEGFDVKLLPQMIADPSAAPAGGSTSFAVASGTFAVGDGAVVTHDLRAEGPAFEVTLAGKARVADPAIEARGVLTLLGEPPQDVPFLVDGTWSAPRLLPDLGGPLPREGGERANSPLPTDG